MSFSLQSFSTTYWQKRPDLDAKIFMKSVGCMGNRQIARDLGVSVETVTRRIARLARHCLLLHCEVWKQGQGSKTVAVDGFESFAYSQYRPFHFNVAVEPDTDFFLFFNDSELRRKGRMTQHQKRRRQELEEKHGRPDPKAIEKAMADLLTVCVGGRSGVRVLSDEHPAYPRAIQRARLRVRHERTSSKAPRTSRNPLWPVNLLDLIVRHSQSNHKRETIAFSKRLQGAIDRLAILLCWRNYMKSRREKKPGTTPAMLEGLADRPWPIAEVLACRLFPNRCQLTTTWRRYYERKVKTPEIPNGRIHDLKYAF